jgi:hypothetical protein
MIWLEYLQLSAVALPCLNYCSLASEEYEAEIVYAHGNQYPLNMPVWQVLIWTAAIPNRHKPHCTASRNGHIRTGHLYQRTLSSRIKPMFYKGGH